MGDSPRRARQTHLRGLSSLKDSQVKAKGTFLWTEMERDSPSSGCGSSKGAPGGRSLGGRTGGGRWSPRPRPSSDAPSAPRLPPNPTLRAPPGSASASRVSRLRQPPQGPLQESSVPDYDRALRKPSSRTKTRETPARLPGRQRPRRPRRPRRRRGRGCRGGGAGGRGCAAPTKGRRGAGRPAC